jgi:hypothetical protein
VPRAKSEQFGKLFSEAIHFSENSLEIPIEDCSFKAFYSVLEWLYKGDIAQNGLEAMLETWHVAHRFALKDLHR